MAMQDLPPEIVDLIATYLGAAVLERRCMWYRSGVADRLNLARYACISRVWQYTIEERTFANLELDSASLKDFHEIVATKDETSNRRAALREICFTPLLPEYSEEQRDYFEDEFDQESNNVAYTDAIRHLFASLALCEGTGKPIHLRLCEPESVTDCGPRYDGLGLDKHRYEHSFLRLLAPQVLPKLRRVTSFTSMDARGRFTAASSIFHIASKLRKLTSLTVSASDDEKKYLDIRRRFRNEFAATLQAVRFPALQSFSLVYRCYPPDNERFYTGDMRDGSGEDMFSQALGAFLRSHHDLVTVKLDGPMCLSPAFFDNTGREPCWPKLQSFILTTSSVRPDGGWYFDADPRAVFDDNDSQSEVLTESDVESSTYDSGDSFFESDGSDRPIDVFDDKEKRLNGELPSRCFRSVPNQAFEQVLQAMTRSTRLMPNVRSFMFGVDLLPTYATQYTPASFEFVFDAKGTEAPPMKHFDNRCMLTVSAPHGWSMSEDMQAIWDDWMGLGAVIKTVDWLR